VEKNWPQQQQKQWKYFKVKHKVLKNSIHGQIWSDLEKISLKMSGQV
jgi:hypothetical protein